MDWNAVKVFLAIASTGTLSGAAKQLGVNHSTIFRRLNSFEQDIGSRLFERLNHGYDLTPSGEEFLTIANNIATSFEDMERHIVGKDVQPKGIVKITAPNNIAYRYLPRYLAEFRSRYPEIRLEILASNLEFNMSSRQADIAIRATPSPPDFLVGRQLRTISWGVYGSTNYAQLSELPSKLEQLQQHALIGATTAMRNLPAFVWMEKNLSQQIYTRCDDLVTMSYLAEAGLGLAFLPHDQIRPGIKKLFTLKQGDVSKLWILTHPDLRNVERIRLVIQHLSLAFSEEKFI
ncbi:MAG: LysR family transcriptional regulator [Thiohalomonadales bacterium]